MTKLISAIHRLRNAVSAATFCAIGLSCTAEAQEPIKIAFIDPQSGTFAATGESGYMVLDFAADYFFNDKGGILGGRQFEVIALDNKNSAADSQLQLRRAISEGIQVVFSGNGSAVASALSTAIERHNRRNPDSQVLFINYAAVDPILTGADCNFWHFRFDAHSDMKMEVMTDHIARNPDIDKVYIIGQDYSFGKAVGDAAISMLAAKRPDIQIVGNELHPIGQVKDFTPYITKIVSSGANAVITGNWGADMVALGRGIMDAGLEVPIYTFYAAYDGITATLGEAAKGQIRLVHNDHANPITSDVRREFTRAYKAKNPHKDVTQPRLVNALMMLAAAMEKAGSTQPYDVALAMEDMRITTMSGEEIWMRPSDHQIFQSLNVSVHTNENIEFDSDNSGFGLLTEFVVPMEETITENNSCRMERPQQ
ncbi:MAG: branched-chain amino acid ABC transporter substrate-binding protein [Gammaproteobacteria bacterium RIFCSPLOWO2_02_FULL_57_10]|nr:MAG: branched-chain amino acid ABC transporter substrate-binding protein [Gammaproteobacteria bacterium RIFCSPLOWO2_02_FULL_57_10]